MSRRTFVLHEMGHTPLWQHRDTLAANLAPPPLPAEALTEAPPARVAPVVVAPAVLAAVVSKDLSPAIDTTLPGIDTAAPDSAPIEHWPALHQQVAACQRCDLAHTRHQVVVGRGNENARLLIIGEAPGEQEDRQGLPFVGKAGQLLENMLAAAGISSAQDAYICNVIKCRPPGNRNPTPHEIARCQPYLRWQIDTIQPDLIVALGRFAAHTLLNSQAPISALRNQLHQAYGRPLLVTFHPAYLLRSPAEKAKAWQDWHRVKCQLAG